MYWQAMDEKSTTIAGSDQDDWVLQSHVTPTQKFGTPSFIRLFIINRIIGKYVKDKHSDKDVKKQEINNLVINTDLDSTQQKTAKKILSNLIIKHGIKKFMSNYYNENKHAFIIEHIFQKLILINYSKEYQELTTYINNNNDNDNDSYSTSNSQCRLLNASDLMCTIYQYLEFSDLIQCSLVNSNFLYDSFNPNSIYYAKLTHLISSCAIQIEQVVAQEIKSKDKNKKKKKQRKKHKTTNANANRKNNDDNNDHVTTVRHYPIERQWQRFINVKHVDLSLSSYHIPQWQPPNDRYRTFGTKKLISTSDDFENFILSKLLMLSNIEIIHGLCLIYHLKILQAILSKNRLNISKYSIRIDNEVNKLTNTTSYVRPLVKTRTPLILANSKDITLGSLDFAIKWSNKCENLTILRINYIDNEWCKYIINNCDCSNIKYLNIFDMTFMLDNQLNINDKININTVLTETDNILANSLLKQMALKFGCASKNGSGGSNLKCLKIIISRPNDSYNTNYYSCMLLFWSLLKPIIDKNNVRVEFYLLNGSISIFNKCINALQLSMSNNNKNSSKNIRINTDFQIKNISKVNILHINCRGRYNDIKNLKSKFLLLRPIYQNKYLEYFILSQCTLDIVELLVNTMNIIGDQNRNMNKNTNISNISNNNTINSSNNNNTSNISHKYNISKYTFSSLMGIELAPPNVPGNTYNDSDKQSKLFQLNTINNFLSLNIISKRKWFIVLHFLVAYNETIIQDFTNEFSIFCDQIYLLLIKKRIPMDIIVEFDGATNVSDSIFHTDYFDIYESYFNSQKMINEYKKPICNLYCNPLEMVKTSFVFDKISFKNGAPVFRIANAIKSDKCIQIKQCWKRHASLLNIGELYDFDSA